VNPASLIPAHDQRACTIILGLSDLNPVIIHDPLDHDPLDHDDPWITITLGLSDLNPCNPLILSVP
jgi:hypothetical protein